MQRYPTSIHAPGCAVHVPFRAVDTLVHAKAGGRVRGVRGAAGCYQGDLGGCYQGGLGGEEERSHTDPTTTLVWVGLWQALAWLIPTHITCIQSWPSGTNVTN